MTTPEQRARELVDFQSCGENGCGDYYCQGVCNRNWPEQEAAIAAALSAYGDEREREALGKIAEELRGPVMALLLELPESVHADFVQRVRRAIAAKDKP